ncbi:MAG: PilT/PilU family type 4a pilus ATPase [Gemmatimonadetes bacterium]|nr:PilT/PilU family type 4a pilus ATPase [Gemmatimonadota bacterium]NNM05391.1 PilT/PilU family type 4a pilus ATPase [Gemmatimonadota bacterium]
MIEIFRAAIENGASDVHIKSGDMVRARIHGKLVPMTEQRLSQDQVKDLALKLIPREKDRERIDELLDLDCSWGLPGLGRFRVNILRQRGSFMIVLRTIPIDVPTIEDLRLPPILKGIADLERGLILVTGVTGAGKSSTQAALVQHINKKYQKHIVTLENPIEFLHRDIKGSVTQRDVGTDTDSFMTGLRAALRQDPDVILIGEMRDKETIDTALKAAETGHVVISTLHTQNAFQTITRLLAVFPRDEQEIIRIRLAEALHAVVSQRLLPKKGGKGRVVACEVMLATGTIRECILDPARAQEIPLLIEEGRQHYGSQSFDQHLMDLVREDLADFEVAKANSNNPSDFELKMNVFGSSSTGQGQGGSGVEGEGVQQAGLADEMRNMMNGD